MPETSDYYQTELTLPDLLYRAAHRRKDPFIGFVNERGEIKKQTYKQLFKEAKLIASGLYHLGLSKGDKVIIVTQHNQETIDILWGCFLLGIVPTILQSPMTFSGYNQAVIKLMDVFEQLGHPYVFLSPELEADGRFEKRTLHRGQLICSGEYPTPALQPDDLAYIQFSSGSTGDPKGIMLTHRNLVVNMDAIRIGLDLHYPDNVGNWMPLFHDMGLIGYHLTPMYGQTTQYHIETPEFIMKPRLWLDLMGHRNISISGGTNFALTLVLRYLKRNKPDAGWDFSSMKSLLNGAEPISVRVMQEYIDALEPFGFRREAMMPVYGLAEATLAVSFSPLMQPSIITAFHSILLDRENRAHRVDVSDLAARVLAGVGVALNDVEIRIAEDDGLPLPEGLSGQILVKGAGIMKGYFNKPESTADTFQGEWLKTGDIGFFFEGQLYISGRRKDIIFRNGRHYFANDLESVACELDEIKYGKVCFGATTNSQTGLDKVIVFAANIAEQKAKETFTRLQALMRSKLGITVDEMVLIKSNEIPKTSSGKLQRFILTQRYKNHDFDPDRIITNPSI